MDSLQVLQLLKSSFTSTNVLNDVFGKYCADVKTAGTAQTFSQSASLLISLPSC